MPEIRIGELVKRWTWLPPGARIRAIEAEIEAMEDEIHAPAPRAVRFNPAKYAKTVTRDEVPPAYQPGRDEYAQKVADRVQRFTETRRRIPRYAVQDAILGGDEAVCQYGCPLDSRHTDSEAL